MAQKCLSPTDVPISELPVVEFDERWTRIIYHLAQARRLKYDHQGRETLYGDRDSFNVHAAGVAGELAAQLSAGVDTESQLHMLSDPGYDFEIRGFRFDVKSTQTTKTKLPKLLVSAEQDMTCDVYLLTHVLDSQHVRIIGYEYAPIVHDREPRRYPRDRGNYVVPAEELRIPHNP